jgi:hypothetical protein
MLQLPGGDEDSDLDEEEYSRKGRPAANQQQADELKR